MYACNVIVGLHLSVYVKEMLIVWLTVLQGQNTNISVRAVRIAEMLYAGFNAFCVERKLKLRKIDVLFKRNSYICGIL